MKTNQSALHIGVDVGKQQLDFFCHESGQHFVVANTTVSAGVILPISAEVKIPS